MDKEYTERDIENLFSKFMGDYNSSNKISLMGDKIDDNIREVHELKKKLKSTEEKADKVEKENIDLKFFIENSEICPDCHKLILSNSRECKHCGTEFIPPQKHNHQH